MAGIVWRYNLELNHSRRHQYRLSTEISARVKMETYTVRQGAEVQVKAWERWKMGKDLGKDGKKLRAAG